MALAKAKDKWSVARAGFSDVEKAVVKATNHETVTPKEKHVRNIIRWAETGYDGKIGIPEIINMLGRRLRAKDWPVVMKALIVFHRMLREGPARFLDELTAQVSLFINLNSFKDDSSPDAWEQSSFVVAYARYLEEKLYVYRDLGYEVEKERNESRFRTMTSDDLFHALPLVQAQLGAVLDIEPNDKVMNNGATQAAFLLILNDIFRLYRAVNDGVLNILEKYFSMAAFEAQAGLDVYKKFMKQTDTVIMFLDQAKRFLPRAHDSMPTLHHAPTTLIPALEEYLSDLKNGQDPGKSAKIPDVKELLRTATHRDSTDLRQEEDKMERFFKTGQTDVPSDVFSRGSDRAKSPTPGGFTSDQEKIIKEVTQMGFTRPEVEASLRAKPTNDINVLLDNLNEGSESASPQPARSAAVVAAAASPQAAAAPAASDPFGDNPFGDTASPAPPTPVRAASAGAPQAPLSSSSIGSKTDADLLGSLSAGQQTQAQPVWAAGNAQAQGQNFDPFASANPQPVAQTAGPTGNLSPALASGQIAIGGAFATNPNAAVGGVNRNRGATVAGGNPMYNQMSMQQQQRFVTQPGMMQQQQPQGSNPFAQPQQPQQLQGNYGASQMHNPAMTQPGMQSNPFAQQQPMMGGGAATGQQNPFGQRQTRSATVGGPMVGQQPNQMQNQFANLSTNSNGQSAAPAANNPNANSLI